LNDSIHILIRQVLAESAGLSVDIASLADRADLFSAGMSSHATVNVMVALEDAFGVVFPDAMLERSVFETIETIASAIAALQSETPA
jgi:acyl carrier protein